MCKEGVEKYFADFAETQTTELRSRLLDNVNTPLYDTIINMQRRNVSIGHRRLNGLEDLTSLAFTR